MLYRTIWPLSLRDGSTVAAGCITPLAGVAPKSLAALEARGAIAPVASPPLVALPNWQARARKLTAAGVLTIAEVIEADPVRLARTCRVALAVVTAWQEEALLLLARSVTPTTGNGYAGG